MKQVQDLKDVTWLVAVGALGIFAGCADDEKKPRDLGQELYDFTLPKAEMACVGRRLVTPEEQLHPPMNADLCINLLSWGFPIDCEEQAIGRYPDYTKLLLTCLHDRHDDLVRCCTAGGPTGGAKGLCDVKKIDACVDWINEHLIFCPGLPAFVGEGIVAEANACSRKKGFSSLGGGTLPPVCGEDAICIADHF